MNAVLEKLKKKPKGKPAVTTARPAAVFVHGQKSGTPIVLPASIKSALEKVKARQLRVSLAEFPVRLLTILPFFWLLRAATDRAFNLSWTVRLGLLVLDLGLVAALFYFYVMIPWRKRLTLRTAALQIERTITSLRTSLISAVELAAAPPASPEGSSVLVNRLIQKVGQKLHQNILIDQVVQTKGLKKRAKWMFLSLLLFAACFWYFHPKSLILGKRILLSRTPLPTLTIVEAVTKEASIAAGTDIELAARATGFIPKTGRMLVIYDDGRKETVNLSAKPVEPAVFSVTLRNVRQPFRYQFMLNDGVGSEYKVEIRMLPSLSLTRFMQNYPAYTGQKETEMSSGNLLLLYGSKLRIEAESTQPLRSAVLELQGLDQELPLEITGADKRSIRKEIPVPKEGLTGLSIHLVSAAGEKSSGDPVYRVELIQDKVPTVALTIPKTEKITVLAADAPSLTYSIRDDFGVKEVALVYEVFRTGGNGQPELAEKGRLPLNPASPQTSVKNTMAWDLDKLIPPLVVGSTVSYWIEAKDNNALPGPSMGLSQKKILEVVSQEAKKKELQDEIAKRADEVLRIYERSVKENDKTDAIIRSNQETKP